MLKSIINKGYVALLALILALVSGILAIYLYTHRDKVRYVTTGKLVDEFTMTKEKKKQVETLHLRRKGWTDSIEFQLTQLERRIEQGDKSLMNEYQFKKEFYIEKTKAFEEEDETLEMEFQKQVFAQINQFVKDYGTENRIDLILGASGNGSIMHCDDKLDITKEVISYINKRYAGKR